MLVTRYYERLLRQHGRTPQALAERAEEKDRSSISIYFKVSSCPSNYRCWILAVGWAI